MLKYTLKKLDNGLRVLIINTPKLSHLDATMYVKVGSIDEDKNNNGISHLLEHLLFLGNKKTGSELMSLEVYPYTNKFFTHFEITTHKDFIKSSLDTLFSAIANPQFTNNNLGIAKRIILEEMADSRNDLEGALNQKIDEFLYENNSLSLGIIGKERIINNISLGDLKKWHARYYSPDNMILTLVGNINPEKTTKQINEIFHFDNPEKKKNKMRGTIIYSKLKRRRRENHLFGRTYLSFIFPAARHDHPLYLNYLFLAEIFYKKIRQDLESSGLIYDIELYYQPQMNNGEYRIITACRSVNAPKIVKRFLSLIDSWKISDDFFEKSKDQIKHHFLLKEDRVDELSSLSLYLLDGQEKLVSLQDELDKIEKIELEDIIKLKKETINHANCYFFRLN